MKIFKKLILGAVTAAAAAVMSLGAVPDGVLPGFSIVASAADTYLSGGTADNPTILTGSDSTDETYLSDGYYALNANAVFSGNIKINDTDAPIIINLNGNTLQATYIHLVWGPTVTINGGSGNAKGKLKLTSGYNGVEAITFSWPTNLTIENTVIEAESCSGNSIGGNKSDDSVTLTNVEFTANSKSMWFKGTTVLDNCSNVPAIETVGGSLNVRNGTVLNGFLNCQGTTTTITDSVINGGISNYNSSITITGSEINNCTVSNYQYANAAQSTISISNSEITGAAISNSTIDSGTVIKSTTVTNSTVGGEQVTNDTYDENGNTGYKVTFYNNDGTTDVYTTQKVASNGTGKATAPTDPTRTGYTFKGWYTTSACTGTAFDFANTAITANTTLYAKWLQHITYIDAAGASATVTDYTPVTSDTTSWSGTMVVADDVTINGQIVLHGGVDLILCDGKKLTVTTPYNRNRIEGSGINIFGQSGQTGKLIVSATGGGCFSLNGSLNIYGGDIEATTSGSFGMAAHDGVTIVRGKVNASGFNAIQANGGKIIISGGNVTAVGNSIGGALYGYNGVDLGWTEPTDSISLTGKINVYNDSKVTIADGKYFIDGAGALYSGTLTSEQIEAIAGKSLYPAYKVTFKAEGIDDFYGGAPRTTGKVTVPTAPTREGYTFGGWYTTDACTTAFDFANTTITEDTIIYGKWRKNLTADNVTVDDLTYNGEEQTVTVKLGDDTLTAETDYTVTYSPAPVKNAGEYTANISGIGDYAETLSVPFTVSPKEITVSGITASNKTYDGTTDAELDYTNAVLLGKLENDTLTVSATGAFASADVGENKNVTISGLTLGGASADNYVLAASGQQPPTTANITVKPVTVTADNKTKAVGENDPTLTATITGLVGSDTVNYTLSRAAGEDVGTYTITPSGDTEQGNYTVTYQAGTFTITKGVIAVTSVSLNKTSTTLTVDGSETLTAIVLPVDATDKTVTWTSDNTAVATVANGVVTAKSAGTAKITASAGGKSAECTVTVKANVIAVTGILLNKTSTTLTVDGSETLTAIVLPVDATDKTVTWTSDNTAVATVANGVVTARSAGTAKITASAGGKSAECTVTVKANVIAVTGITLNKTSTTLTVDGSETLTAIVLPVDATDKTVTWTSDNTAVATVANGVVTAAGAGAATITAAAGDKTATCIVVTVRSSGGGNNDGGSYTPVIPSYPSGGSTTTTTTNTNEPKIEGGSGAYGWSNIASEIGKTPAGSCVIVDMNGTTTVPTNVLNALKGKDVDLVLDMGGGITWTINGKDITNVSGSIDLGVKLGTSDIPIDVVNNVTGEHYSTTIHLNHSGKFGFKAVMTVPLRKQDAGLTANLFYYNPSKKVLEFVSSAKIDANGNAELDFNHASDYAIIIDDHDLGRDVTAAVSRTGNLKLSWTAQSGAKSYTVYTMKNGMWKKLRTTAKNTLTVTGLKNGKTYKFLIRYSIDGKLSEIADSYKVSVTAKYKPIVSLTANKGSITVRWSKVEGAENYRIYKYVNGNFKFVTETAKRSVCITGTKSGKEYSYAVKALVDGKWTTVSISDIATVTAK